MKKVILTTSLMAGIIIGCGSSSSSFSNELIKGKFVDSPVEGLKYVSKDFNGTTDKNGYYQCKSKENVTFYAGETKIGTTTCSKLTTPLTVANNNKTVAENIAYFIQNIDKDGNINNGIQILDNIPSMNIDFSNKSDIDNALNNLGITPKITPDEAYNNLKDYLAQMNQNSKSNNVKNNVNVDLKSYQSVVHETDNGYKVTKAISLIGGNQYLQLDKTNAEINVLKPFKVKEIYTKMTALFDKDLTTGVTSHGYIEYYYPEGKVHYDGYDSKHGYVNCTAYYDVSNLDRYITPGDDISDYYNFDDQKNLKDKGNCPDWILSDDDDNDNEIYKIEGDTTITNTNNTQIKIKEYYSKTK